MKITTVIFDLDGTITRPFLDFDAMRAEMGLSADAGPILEAMEHMSEEERTHAEQVLLEHESRAADESVLNDGARRTLDALRRAGIKIGILTRNKRINAEAVARKHNLAFDAIVDRGDGPAKPDAFGVLRLCEIFAAKPAETLVVGDFLYDLLSAKAANATAVLLKNSEKTQKFAKYADFTVASLDEILKIIDNMDDNTEKDNACVSS